MDTPKRLYLDDYHKVTPGALRDGSLGSIYLARPLNQNHCTACSPAMISGFDDVGLGSTATTSPRSQVDGLWRCRREP